MLRLFLATVAFLFASSLSYASVTVRPTAIVTSEDGANASFEVVLQAAPSPGETVTISIEETDLSEGAVSPASVSFTAADWDFPKAFVISPGASGDGSDGDVTYDVRTAVTTVGGTGLFAGASAADLLVTNRDIDGAPTITANPAGGAELRVTEGRSIDISLSAVGSPLDDVSVDVSVAGGEATVFPPTIVLSSMNGFTSTFSVTAVADTIVDANQPFTIVTEPSVSTDAAFAGIDLPDIPGVAVNVDAPERSLPLFETYQGADTTAEYRFPELIRGVPGFEAIPGSGGRLRYWGGIDPNGNRVITLDNPNCDCSNFIVASFDASGFSVVDPVYLSFVVFRHGDENDNDDRVWVRGAPSDPWLEVFDVTTVPSIGSEKVANINLSTILAGGSQVWTSRSAVRFGQNDNFPYATDGASFDDIVIDTPNSPLQTDEDLTAFIDNFDTRPVDDGDAIRTIVRVHNPPGGSGSMANVVIERTAFNPQAPLVVGSVTTSLGSVVTGNTAGDTSMRVEVPVLDDGDVVEVMFTSSVVQGLAVSEDVSVEVSSDTKALFLAEHEGTTLVSTAIIPRQPTLSALTVNPPSAIEGGSSTLSVTTDTPDAGPISFFSSTPITCSVSGTTLNYEDGGTCTVGAAQAASSGAFSSAVPVTTDIEVVSDTDRDGTPDSLDAFPNDPTEDTDSDMDGIGDNSDPFVNAVTMATSGGASLETELDDPASTCSIETFDSVMPDTASAPGPVVGPGLTFRLTDCSPGETIIVSIDFGISTDRTALYKVDEGVWTTIADAVSAGQSVTYTIIDNGTLDLDDTPGAVEDPVALIALPPEPIPSVPHFLLVVLAALMGVATYRWKRAGRLR